MKETSPLCLQILLKENYFEDRHAKEVQNKIVYKICAMDNSYNRSKYSEPIYVRMRDLSAPAVPIMYEATVENNAVNMVWSKNSDLDFKHFEISRGTRVNDSSFGNYAVISNSRESNFIDRTIVSNTEYDYLISAIDSSNNRSESASRIVFNKESKKAEVIQNFEAQKSDNSIRLKWSNPNKLIIQLFRKEETGTFIPISNKFSGDSIEDKDVIKGKTYSYKIISIGDEDDVMSEAVNIEFQ